MESRVHAGEEEGEDIAMVEKESGISLWSNIHDDILQLIMERFGKADQVRLRAVCKNWLSHPSAVEEKQPWTMIFHSSFKGEFTWELYEPCGRRPKFKRRIEDTDGLLPGSIFCDVNCGWVLLTTKQRYLEIKCFVTDDGEEEQEEEESVCYAFFLHNPFNKEFVRLPDFKFDFVAKNNEGLEVEGEILLAKFSSSPTRSDCVFFLLVKAFLPTDLVVAISTCRPGDETWNTIIPSFDSCFLTVESAVFMGGCFYCYFWGGELGSFNVTTQEWTMICTKKYFPLGYFDGRSGYGSNGYLVESAEFGGELLLIYGCEILSCAIYRFDWTGKGWVVKQRLNQQAMFFDPRTANSIPTKEIGSRIYLNAEYGPLCLTYDDGGSGLTYYDGGRIYGPSFRGRIMPYGIWITPPPFEA